MFSVRMLYSAALVFRTLTPSEASKNIINTLSLLLSSRTATPHGEMDVLRLPTARDRGKPAQNTLLIKTTKPWARYERIYALRLGLNEPFLVAKRKSITSDLFSIRRFAPLTNHQFNVLELIQHPNFATAYEIYKLEDSHLVVFEHLPLSLAEAAGNPYLTGPRLAAIIGQVVEALEFLEQNKLRHNHLTCSNILLHPNGRVKLIGQEDCVESSSQKDIRDLGRVMVELIQGYTKESDNVGLGNSQGWDIEVFDFLSATSFASSASELQKLPFLEAWQKEKLKGLVSLVMKWAMPDCDHLGRNENGEA